VPRITRPRAGSNGEKELAKSPEYPVIDMKNAANAIAAAKILLLLFIISVITVRNWF
jgi:hypothetical protein